MAYFPPPPVTVRLPFNIGPGSLNLAPNASATSPGIIAYNKQFDPNQVYFLYQILGTEFVIINMRASTFFTAQFYLANAIGGPPNKAYVEANLVPGGTFKTLYPNIANNVDSTFTEAVANLPLSFYMLLKNEDGANAGSFSWDAMTGYMAAIVP